MGVNVQRKLATMLERFSEYEITKYRGRPDSIRASRGNVFRISRKTRSEIEKSID